MKDLPYDFEVLFSPVPADESLDRIDAILKSLREDGKRSVHDKVIGPFDFEELIAALLSARAKILELEDEVRSLDNN
ncbi:hypothetical protein [Roseibacillus ishigakijimensis]|uniref:Uncharacterized protein n=1 Tax=Roseibacillus ishigakijimensis TaxID=454146 RepID=A0A934RT85_9BACT|nr:hypothetical protein [Roseibacillus ishigakijimensis]MBK1835018.1 hypothetical protein [Roseibacillus ishigakijimensis]